MENYILFELKKKIFIGVFVALVTVSVSVYILVSILIDNVINVSYLAVIVLSTATYFASYFTISTMLRNVR